MSKQHPRNGHEANGTPEPKVDPRSRPNGSDPEQVGGDTNRGRGKKVPQVGVSQFITVFIDTLLADRRVWLFLAGTWASLVTGLILALLFSCLVVGVSTKVYLDYRVDKLSKQFEKQFTIPDKSSEKKR